MRGLIIFTIGLLFISCSGGDNEVEPILSLKNTKLTLESGNTDTLIVNAVGIESLQWETDNDFSIAVNNEGIVTAIRVGEAIVTVKDSGSELKAECNITVNPKYNTITEPPLIFGENQVVFKAEMDKLSDYSYLVGNEMFLNYEPREVTDSMITMIMCLFNENKLKSIVINLKDITNITEFLSERYKLIDTEGTAPITYSFINKNGDMSVTYKKELSVVGSTITYTPVEDSEQ